LSPSGADSTASGERIKPHREDAVFSETWLAGLRTRRTPKIRILMDLMKLLQSKKTLGKIELFLAQKYDTLVKNSGLLIEIRMTRYLEPPEIVPMPRRLAGKYVIKFTHNRHVIENIRLYQPLLGLKLWSRLSYGIRKKRSAYCR
jgi:hypothetical protein